MEILMGECVGTKFRIGDWVKIYYGHYEGHEFMIKGNRVNDFGDWEYLYEWPLYNVWCTENSLTLLRPAGINS